ncbi:MAG: hypothetical protein IJS08_13675 [Victivallales bacterium]|nr:hypothetical protein [Victivallales bacterium]
MNNTSESLEFDYNPTNSLGAPERRMLMSISGPQDRLEYPTETLKMANGCEVERYVIPDEDKEKVLEAVYPFFNVPGLDEERLDVHTGKTFKIRDYIVTREGNCNFLVSPYYAEAGGTVLDWVILEINEDCRNIKSNPICIDIVRN